MAAPSRMMFKSSSAALNIFTKSKSILNLLPPSASALVLSSPESGSSRLIDQLAASRLNSDETRLRFLNYQPLPAWWTMLMARGPRKVVESEHEGSESDEDDDSEDIEDFDADDSDEEPDDGESEEDEPWKKVRTRSRRDD